MHSFMMNSRCSTSYTKWNHTLAGARGTKASEAESDMKYERKNASRIPNSISRENGIQKGKKAKTGFPSYSQNKLIPIMARDFVPIAMTYHSCRGASFFFHAQRYGFVSSFFSPTIFFLYRKRINFFPFNLTCIFLPLFLSSSALPWSYP